MELLGGQIKSSATREHLMYEGSVFAKDIGELMEMFSEIIRYPKIDSKELEHAKEATRYEMEDVKFNSDVFLPEMLHSLAYRNNSKVDPLNWNVRDVNTLGYSQKIDAANLDSMSASKLTAFRNKWITPNRAVVCAVGIEHEALLEVAEKYFGSWESPDEELFLEQRFKSTPSKYSGGTFVYDTSNLPRSPNPDDMVLTHCQIAFESFGATDPDVYSLATLGSLLGGGGSFSAGGPGKGMYTRLYTQVLNQNGWIESCNVINHSHRDSGLFGITAAVPSDASTHHHLPHVICDQILNTTADCTQVELERAKNQLKSNLLMTLESKPIELEDIGRQILFHGKRMDVLEMCNRVDMIEASDLVRVARRVFLGEDHSSRFDFNDGFCHPHARTGDGNPTILVHGPLTGPKDSLWKVNDAVAKWGLTKKPKRSLFSKL